MTTQTNFSVRSNLHVNDKTLFRAEHLRVGADIITTLTIEDGFCGSGFTIFLTDAQLAKLEGVISAHLSGGETEVAA